MWELLGLLKALKLLWAVRDHCAIGAGQTASSTGARLSRAAGARLSQVHISTRGQCDEHWQEHLARETKASPHHSADCSPPHTPMPSAAQKAHYFILSPQIHTFWIQNLPTLCHSFHRPGQRTPAKTQFEPRHLAQPPHPATEGWQWGAAIHAAALAQSSCEASPRRAHPMQLGLWLRQARGTQAELLLRRWNLKRCLRRAPRIQQQLTGTGSTRPTSCWPNVKALQTLTGQVQCPQHLCRSTDPPLSGCITLKTFKTKNAYI